MVSLLNFVWFLVLLNSVCCDRDPHLAENNASPIINLKLDPRKKMLTWNYRRNVTQQSCHIETPLDPDVSTAPQVTEDNTCFCIFPNSVLHRGATLTLQVTSDGNEFQEVLAFNNSGQEGSSAVNFSCLIYNIHFMSCTWAPGPAAPVDVQYHLYSWVSMIHSGCSLSSCGYYRQDDETECGRYVVDSMGTHVGCRFDKLGEPKMTDNYFFLVNGTSKETAVQFLDFAPFRAFTIEKYNPPANITISYNGSNHIIQWDNPEIRFDLSSHVLYYEIDIQRKGGSPARGPVFQRGQDKNVYLVPSSDSKTESALRMRVRHLRGEVWSDWSRTVRVGVQEQGDSSVPVGLVVLVMGAVALPALVLMFLCKRFSIKDRLFPPIPQVKGALTGMSIPSLEINWEGTNLPPDSQEPEDVLMVEEML